MHKYSKKLKQVSVGTHGAYLINCIPPFPSAWYKDDIKKKFNVKYYFIFNDEKEREKKSPVMLIIYILSRNSDEREEYKKLQIIRWNVLVE